MSTSLATFSFPPPFNDQQAEPNLSLVAPPIPATGGPITEADFAFDFGSFSTDATFDTINWDLSGFESDPPSLTDSSSTPGSIDIVSPKSSFSSFGDASSPFNNTAAAVPAYQGIDIEALSKHHFERFLHYKTLADEAERKAKASLVQPGGFETLLAPIDMNVNTAVPAQQSFDSSMLMSYPTNLGQQYDQQPRAQSSFVYNPHVTEASMAQAQADAHLHAHNVAVAQVQQQRFYTQPQQPQQQQQHHGQAQAPSQYWVQPARTSFDAGSVASVSSASMSEPAWSRTSFSTNQSVSPPFSATPVAPISDVVQNAAKESLGLVNGMAPLPLPLASMPGPISSAPLANSVPAMAPSAALAEFVPASAPAPVKGGKKQVLNPHGGGRGYVPGKTPDDPKKRHKCVVCGRGFARAFNLKSHFSTHDPERSKPHMCPHSSCKRGFSRLHDLERHRQGIHNDGPLVDAKRHGVTPSVARAQVRSSRSSTPAQTTTVNNMVIGGSEGYLPSGSIALSLPLSMGAQK